VTLPRILLVDDSDAILAYETAALGRDYALAQASDGLAALAEMRRETPALVLLDLSMPVCDGDEVLREMRASPELSEVPVIVVTSETARGRECLTKGASAFLPKPASAAELRAVVAKVLRAAATAKQEGDVHALVFSVGSLTLAVPLTAVGEVVLEPATTMALVLGEPFPSFDLHGVGAHGGAGRSMGHRAQRRAPCLRALGRRRRWPRGVRVGLGEARGRRPREDPGARAHPRGRRRDPAP
jgi:two-component system chemotaxis response regulator CheY